MRRRATIGLVIDRRSVIMPTPRSHVQKPAGEIWKPALGKGPARALGKKAPAAKASKRRRAYCLEISFGDKGASEVSFQ